MLLLGVRGYFVTNYWERSILGSRVPGKKNMLTLSFPRRLFYPENDQYGDRVLLFLPAECMVCFMVISCRFLTRFILSVGRCGLLEPHWDIRYHGTCCQR
jgi:hypothetical protein